MTIDLAQVRAKLLLFGLNPGKGFEKVGKLPRNFSTHPGGGHHIDVGGAVLMFKVLSSDEAKRAQPKSRRPHRIFVWDDPCKRWVPAGKYAQHCRNTPAHVERDRKFSEERGKE